MVSRASVAPVLVPHLLDRLLQATVSKDPRGEQFMGDEATGRILLSKQRVSSDLGEDTSYAVCARRNGIRNVLS